MSGTGYSGKPVCHRLGIQGRDVIFTNLTPNLYQSYVSDLPATIQFHSKLDSSPISFAHLFVTSYESCKHEFALLIPLLQPSSVVWISWPKKRSNMVSDLDENKIRSIGLACGLVDVKVIAIDDTWSGLKFVYRLKDR